MKKLAYLFLLTLLLPFFSAYSAPAIQEDVVKLLIPKLNSDRIAYFFGSYGVEPIPVTSSPFAECRIANLYSKHGEEKIMRTLAVVSYQQPIHESLSQVHKSICEGQSIGIALRENGWKMDKVPLYFGGIALSPEVQAWMHENQSDRAAVHIYKLHVFKEGSSERLHYCTIIEVHSPQYLDENWLQSLYSDQYNNYRERSTEIEGLIGSLNSLIREFPNHPHLQEKKPIDSLN